MLEDSVWTSPHYRTLLEKNYAWDYSRSNLLKIKYGNTQLINFYYCDQLSRLEIKKPAKFELVFYGSINERRKKILDVVSKGVLEKRLFFGAYGSESDVLISESRTV